LYILTALPSGGRQSERFNLTTAPIAKLERAAREAHKAKLKRLEAEAAGAMPKDRASILQEAPPDPRTIFVDTTTQKVEHEFVHDSAPALSLSADEGGALLGGHSLKSEVFAAWRYCERGSDVKDATVTGSDMRCAVALVRYSLAEWRRHSAGAVLSPVERDARELLEWLHRKGWKTFTRMKLGQHCPNVLRKDTGRRNAAVEELQRRHWLFELAGRFAVAQKTAAPPAVAVSAVSAGGRARETADTARKATAIDGVALLPEASRRMPETVADVGATVAAVLGSSAAVSEEFF
jgi:hypothetical protein